MCLLDVEMLDRGGHDAEARMMAKLRRRENLVSTNLDTQQTYTGCMKPGFAHAMKCRGRCREGRGRCPTLRGVWRMRTNMCSCTGPYLAGDLVESAHGQAALIGCCHGTVVSKTAPRHGLMAVAVRGVRSGGVVLQSSFKQRRVTRRRARLRISGTEGKAKQEDGKIGRRTGGKETSMRRWCP